MSKMIELIEEMRARLNQVADTEHSLVRALSEALNRVDQKLLQDVRDITTDHKVSTRRHSARIAKPCLEDRRFSDRARSGAGARFR